MSNNKLINTIHAEIDRINESIDLKIIKGQSYAREARRHKFLLSHLTQAIRKDRTNWLQKTATMMSSFLL